LYNLSCTLFLFLLVKLVMNQAQNGGSLGEERMRPGTEMLADNQSSTPDACRPAENISHVSRAQSLHTATSIPPASTSRRPQATRSHTVSTASLLTDRTVVTTDSPLTDRTAATTDSPLTDRNVVTTDSTVTDRNSVTTNSAISTVSVPSAMTDKHTVTSTKSVTNRRTVTTDSETTDIKGIATNQRVSTTRKVAVSSATVSNLVPASAANGADITLNLSVGSRDTLHPTVRRLRDRVKELKQQALCLEQSQAIKCMLQTESVKLPNHQLQGDEQEIVVNKCVCDFHEQHKSEAVPCVVLLSTRLRKDNSSEMMQHHKHCSANLCKYLVGSVRSDALMMASINVVH